MTGNDVKFLDYVVIDRNTALVYSRFLGYVSREESAATFIENFANNKTKGWMSASSKKKIREIVNRWLFSLEIIREHNNYSTSWLKYRITFVTLTLPAIQIENDKENKRNLLNRFLIESYRKWKVNSYIWVAEKQKNGNLHYHILYDRYIEWREIRSLWNKILDANGYIEKYRQAQKLWHNPTFRVRENLLNTWSEAQQREAYEYGVRTNWTDPNSTDIHSLRKIKNPAAYITKYLTKSVDDEVRELREKLRNQNLSDKTIRQEIDSYIRENHSQLLIDGKLWGCSKNLQNLKGINTELTPDITSWLYEEIEKNKCRRYDKDRFSIVYETDYRNLKNKSPTLYMEIVKMGAENYKILNDKKLNHNKIMNE